MLYTTGFWAIAGLIACVAVGFLGAVYDGWRDK